MRILFQGDSITDCGRTRDTDAYLGCGYPLLVQGELGKTEPATHTFINRGVSGNRVVDLYARIKADIINVKPDVLSILIGVNDVWHELSHNNGVDAEKYYTVYCMLIEEIKAALPDVQIMILEPFVLKASATEEHWERFSAEVAKRAEKAKQVAERYGLTFVPLQDGFNALTEQASPDYWLRDGVHPTPMGHTFLKEEWLRAYRTR